MEARFLPMLTEAMARMLVVVMLMLCEVLSNQFLTAFAIIIEAMLLMLGEVFVLRCELFTSLPRTCSFGSILRCPCKRSFSAYADRNYDAHARRMLIERIPRVLFTNIVVAVLSVATVILFMIPRTGAACICSKFVACWLQAACSGWELPKVAQWESCGDARAYIFGAVSRHGVREGTCATTATVTSETQRGHRERHKISEHREA